MEQRRFGRNGSNSEMAGLIEQYDWSGTPLGNRDQWPHSLRTVVELSLATRFPMMIAWGPEFIMIYNDSYRPMLGSTKHPGALGAKVSDVFPEVWVDIGPMLEGVMATADSSWVEDQYLRLDRSTQPEECYFTYSYSPLFDDDGNVGGVLDVVEETTKRVVADRRLRCVAELTHDLISAELTVDAYRLTASVLSGHRGDIGAVDIYQIVNGDPSLVATSRRPGDAPPPRDVLTAVASDHRPVRTGQDPDAHGLSERGPDEHGVGEHGLSEHSGGFYVSPIGGGFEGIEALLAISVNPDVSFDADYHDFVTLICDVVGTALDSAYRRSVEVGAQRRLTDVLENALLQPVSDFATVAARYVPADGSLAIGGDWYDIVDLGDERRALVVGDCVGHGLEAVAVMAQLRSASRAMLLEGRDPAETLEALDAFAATLQGAFCATAVVTVVDRRARTIVYARAGHPPPLVVSGEVAIWLDGAAGVPLAVVPGVNRSNQMRSLEPNDTLILYTDGLIERRGESLDEGLERLADAAIDCVGASSGQPVADALLQLLLPGDIDDDVVIVVKRLLAPEA